VDLVALLDNYIDNCRNVNYKGSLSGTLSLLRRYGVSTDFAHIDKAWLLSLHKQMTEHGLKPNSVGVHMRNIRTILNEAFTMGYSRQYPFRGFKIPRERTCKRNLTVEQMKTIMSLSLSGRDQWSRDMFLLSFYLLGMNLRDMAYLKEIRDGRIEYIRSKGKKHYSVKIFPEALRIISKYKGKRYLLDIMDRYVDYRNAVKYINIDLKKIRPGLSTYAARHSVASIMSSEGVSHDVIARALGHSADNQMTAIYINYDERRTDEAHRRMIDALLPLKASVPLPQFFN
jgi:integrase